MCEVRTATPSCRSCGKAFDLTSRKSFYQGDDAQAARTHAAKVAAQVAGAGVEAVAESILAVERERRPRVEDVVAALETQAEFGVEEVERELGRLKVAASPDRVLALLRSSSRLYEPRPGRYRWLA